MFEKHTCKIYLKSLLNISCSAQKVENYTASTINTEADSGPCISSSVQLFVKCLQFRSLNRVNMYDVVCTFHLCCILKSVFAFVLFPVLLLGTLDLMVWYLWAHCNFS